MIPNLTGHVDNVKMKTRRSTSADPAALEMAEQYSAGRLARPDDADVRAARGETGQARVVIGDSAAMVVGAVNCRRVCSVVDPFAPWQALHGQREINHVAFTC